MVSNENNEEMSVNDIFSSIKEVISSEQDLKKSANDDNFIELTDVVDEEAILLDDVVDLNMIDLQMIYLKMMNKK